MGVSEGVRGAGSSSPPPTSRCSRRLAAEQLARVPALWPRGPEAYGFRGQLWTRGRIAAVIRAAFGVSSHPRHVGRLCQATRWSPQQPARRARQRDEAAIAHWRTGTWAAIKKGRAQARTILFIDESGVYPLLSVVRTYAPIGQTPIRREWYTRDHLSAISAISPGGTRYFHSQDYPIHSDDVVGCLEHLRREVPGRMVSIGNGAPIHRGQVIQQCLARGAAPRLHLERRPADAPEPNPGEGLWPQLQGVELRHGCGLNLPHLTHAIRGVVTRVRRKPRLITSLFQGAQL